MRFGKKAVLPAALVCGLLGAAPGQAAIFEINDTQGVFDGTSDTRTVTFSAAGVIKDVDVTIDFMKCAGAVPSPLPAEPPVTLCDDSGPANAREIIFRISVTSPVVTLPVGLVEAETYFPGDNPGPEPGARITVKFDDEAALTVGGTDFSSGPFKPALGDLSQFDGMSVAGTTWELYIEDVGIFDELGFASFRVDIELCEANDTAPVCQRGTGVPVPATPFLLGLGLAGLAVSRRRLN